MNVKFTSVLLVLLCLAGNLCLVEAQNVPGNLNNASVNAMGGVSAAYKDIRGLAANPAAIGLLKNIQAYVFADQRFGLKELSSYSAGFALPVNSGSFGLTLGRYGYNLYNENQFSAAYARKLFNNLAVGGSIQYQIFNIQDYGNKGIFGFQLGLYSDVSSQIALFFSVSNPGRQKINESERLAGIFNLGAMYTPNPRLSIRAEFCKTLEHKEDLRFGIEYNPSSRVILRLGGQAYPAQFSAGFGIVAFDALVLEASARYDATIGYLPGVGASYGLKYKK